VFVCVVEDRENIAKLALPPTASNPQSRPTAPESTATVQEKQATYEKVRAKDATEGKREPEKQTQRKTPVEKSKAADPE